MTKLFRRQKTRQFYGAIGIGGFSRVDVGDDANVAERLQCA
jgi:hypothetical protein